MAKLTEDRVREIIKEEMAKVDITIQLDGKTIAQSICDQIRIYIGERL